MLQDLYRGAAANDKTGTPARTGGQIINDNFAYLDRKITRKDGIVVSTGFTISGQDVTYNAFWQWIIDTVGYTNPSAVVMNFPLATTGFSRLDMIALTTSNTPIRIAGAESASNPISAALPDNMIQAGFVLVTDSSVGEPSPPIVGSNYVEKLEFTEQIVNVVGEVYIDFNLPYYNSLRYIGATPFLKGLALLPQYKAYSGKKMTVKNFQQIDLVIKHLYSGPYTNTDFFFPSGEDFVLKPGQIVEFAYSMISNRFEFIGVVTDVSTKADLVNGKVPSSQLPSYVDDVLEFTDLASFPATGETGKIYIAISPKNKEYRWSGSSYIQITNGLIASSDDVTEGSTNLYFTVSRFLENLTFANIIAGLGFTPENSSNKSEDIEADKASTIKWYSAKTIYDFITGGFQRKLVAGTNISIDNTNPLSPVISASGSGIKVYNVKDYGALGDGVTDDTAKIQDAINACFVGGGGIVYFPNGIYFIDGALDSNSHSQIYFPLSTFTSTIALKTIKLLGETSPNQYSNPFNATGSNDHPNSGVILKSNLLTVGNVIGCRSESVAWGNFNFIHPQIENISVRVRSMTGSTNVSAISTAINMGNSAFFTAKNIEFCTTSQMAFCVEPASTALGVIMPRNNNFAMCSMQNFNSYGLYVGVDCYEHTHLDNYLIDACVIGIKFNKVNHSIHATKGCIARCRYNIQSTGNTYFYVDNISFENDPLKSVPTPTWNRTIYDLYDLDGLGSGLIRLHKVRASFGVDYSTLLRSRINSKIKFIKINEISIEFNPNNVQPPTSVDLLAYWKFEEISGNYVDSSTNARTAARINGATSGAGKIGNAMFLIASSEQYANAGNAGLSYNGTAVSFSGWFKINTSTNAYQVLFNKGTALEREYNCYYTKSSGTVTFAVYNGITIKGQTSFSITENEWFHMYVEIVGSSLRSSVNNGILSSSTITGALSVNTTSNLFIGSGEALGSSLNGGVDDFAVFANVLTSGNREYLYNGGFGNPVI